MWRFKIKLQILEWIQEGKHHQGFLRIGTVGFIDPNNFPNINKKSAPILICIYRKNCIFPRFAICARILYNISKLFRINNNNSFVRRYRFVIIV